MSSDLPMAIVFNCHYNGLSILQELGRHGIPCIAMDSTRSIGTFSKHARWVRCPDPASAESEFVDFLYDFCAAQGRKPVLFPTNDEWAVAIAKQRRRLSEVAVPCVGDWSGVRQVIEKDVFYEIGRERGYLTPRSWRIDELDDLQDDDYPIAVKPRFRRTASDTVRAGHQSEMDRLRLAVLENRGELARFLEDERGFVDDLIFQEYVSGLSDCMYTIGVYAAQDHGVRGVFTGRKVRGYPAEFGDCIVGEAHDVPPELVAHTRRIVEDLELSGILEFEYKRDARTGVFRLIEINPRSWSWVGITPAAGVNLPLLAYGDLGDSDFMPDGRGNGAHPAGSVRYYKAFPDLVNSVLRYRRYHPEWHQSPWSWWRELRGIDTVIVAEFHARDHLVTIVSALLEGRALLRFWAGSIGRTRPTLRRLVRSTRSRRDTRLSTP
jgi:predicted ATP-grasp superfamily ATP-dependent carboligase